MTRALTPPTPELAERLRREVGPSEQLTGLKMSAMGGSNPTALYSLSDAAGFVRIGSYAEAIRPGSQETVGYVDLGALESWIRNVFGDVELADAIREENASGDVYGIVAPRVKRLLELRVAQVDSLAEGAAASGAEESD